MVQLTTILSASALVASVAPALVAAVPIQSSASQDGLVEREPFLPLLGLGLGLLGGRKRNVVEDDLAARLEDLSEIVERNPEPFLPLLGLGLGLLGGRKRDLTSDELAELVSRNPEPFLPLIGLGLGLLGGRKRDFVSPQREDVFERDFEDVENLDMREFDDDEMAAREWDEPEELD